MKTLCTFCLICLFFSACTERKVCNGLNFPMRTKIAKIGDGCIIDLQDKVGSGFDDGEAYVLNFLKPKVAFEEELEFSKTTHASLKEYIVGGSEDRKVKTIFEKMLHFTSEARYNSHLNIFVVNERELNAFSVPGGNIYVFSKMVNEFTDDELAYVIGHEIGHLENLHLLENVQKINLLGDYSKWYDFLGDPLTQKDEKEADYAGVYLAHKAGYDPRAALTVLKKIDNATRVFKIPKILCSHPPAKERIRCLDAYLDQVERRTKKSPICSIFISLPKFILEEYPSILYSGALLVFAFLYAFFSYKRTKSFQMFFVSVALLIIWYIICSKKFMIDNDQIARGNPNDGVSNILIRRFPKKTSASSDILGKLAPNHFAKIILKGPADKIENQDGFWYLIENGEGVIGWSFSSKLLIKNK
jgi:hypothetical protein